MVSIKRIEVYLHTQATPYLHPTSMISHTNIYHCQPSQTTLNCFCEKMKENAVRKVNRSVCQPINNPIINRETK